MEYLYIETVRGFMLVEVDFNAANTVVELLGHGVEDIIVKSVPGAEKGVIVKYLRFRADCLLVTVVRGEITQFVEAHTVVEGGLQVEIAEIRVVYLGGGAVGVGPFEFGYMPHLPFFPVGEFVLYGSRYHSERHQTEQQIHAQER